MMLELTTRSRRRAAVARRSTVRGASALLIATALTFAFPAAFGLSSHTVTDEAMGGSLGEGAAVVVDSVSVADLEVGDVITYSAPSASHATLLTRRIAEIHPTELRTSGDSTGALDPRAVTLADSTQEKVVAHVPYVGYVIDVLDGPVRYWFAAFLALLIATASMSGVLAARRDTRVSAHDLTLTGPSIGAGVKPPAPRHAGDVRRNSHV